MKYYLTLLIIIPLNCFAAVYTQTDESGNTIYSDTPFANSKTIEVPNSASTVQTPSETIKTTNETKKVTAAPISSENEVETHQPYTVLSITSVTDQQTFQNQREIPVEVSMKPDLQKGDKIQLYVDGQATGEAVAGTHLMANNLERGTHTISVAIINSNKTVLKQTTPITIFVLYAHLGTGTTGG